MIKKKYILFGKMLFFDGLKLYIKEIFSKTSIVFEIMSVL